MALLPLFHLSSILCPLCSQREFCWWEDQEDGREDSRNESTWRGGLQLVISDLFCEKHKKHAWLCWILLCFSKFGGWMMMMIREPRDEPLGFGSDSTSAVTVWLSHTVSTHYNLAVFFFFYIAQHTAIILLYIKVLVLPQMILLWNWEILWRLWALV